MGGIAQHGAGQHDAGAVVVREQHGPLEGAGGHDDAAAADLPQPLAHGAIHGLHRCDEAVVIHPECGAARLHFDTGCGELRQAHGAGRFQAFGPFEQEHRLTVVCRRKCSLDAGQTRAHHQHLHLSRDLVVARRVRRIGRMAQPRHASDDRLEQLPTRPHERLVVEARRQQRRNARAQRGDVEFEAGPGIASEGLQAFSGRDVGGARVGGARAAPSDIQQPGGLFHTAAEDAAWAMQLEAAAGVHDALGQQG